MKKVLAMYFNEAITAVGLVVVLCMLSVMFFWDHFVNDGYDDAE